MIHLKTIPILLIFCSFFWLLIYIPMSSGRPFRPPKLPDGGKNWGCATCHINPAGGGPRNAFGRDYEAIAIPAGDVYTPELGRKDSDGDGFTNDEEFNANPPTEPWNSDSHPPEKPKAVNLRGKLVTIWAKLKRR